jgi:Flp pilus assembly protein TadG
MTRVDEERGSVTLWALGLCLVLLLLGGISLDLWRAFSERRALAAAADAAALAGASALDVDAYREHGVIRLDPNTAKQRAAESLAHQGDRRAVTGARISADEAQVTVEVTGRVDFSLLQIVSPDDAFTVTVRAQARPHASP